MNDFIKKIDDIVKIYNKLEDNESKIIFEARINYMIYRNEYYFFEYIKKLNKKFKINDLDEILSKKTGFKSKIIIAGLDIDGRYTLELLNYYKIYPDFFLSIDSTNVKSFCGKKVLTLYDLMMNFSDYLVIIASKDKAVRYYMELLYCKFPRENILCPRRGVLEGYSELQYFDTLKPNLNEVFLDCGAYDGSTSIQFIKWCNGSYNKIYMFEMDDNNLKLCENTIKKENLQNVTLLHTGLWDKADALLFEEGNFTSSSISDKGICIKIVDSIDNLINDKVSYIKMDIEGAELRALKGAYRTIRKYKPKMAISVYHNPEDIIEIPLYIMKTFNDNYNFILRHYRTSKRETVLYAY